MANAAALIAAKKQKEKELAMKKEVETRRQMQQREMTPDNLKIVEQKLLQFQFQQQQEVGVISILYFYTEDRKALAFSQICDFFLEIVMHRREHYRVRSAETILCCYSGTGRSGGGQSQYGGHRHGGDNPTILSVLSSGGCGGPDDHDSTTHGPTTTNYCPTATPTRATATYDPATTDLPPTPSTEKRVVPTAGGEDDL